jgi:integrase
VIQAARQTPFPFGPIVLLLILTGQRREEVSGMRWSELDFDARTWTIPRERAKNGKTHTVHLTSQAIDIIKACPETGSHVVSLSPDKPFSGWSKSKHRLDEHCGVSSWTLHDLRRTMVTTMSKNGVPPYVADRILNHVTGAIGGVAAVYQQNQFLDERREALELWSKHVEALEHA